jgi:hypothetical protein
MLTYTSGNKRLSFEEPLHGGTVNGKVSLVDGFSSLKYLVLAMSVIDTS